jgi:hypothetical protein
MPIESRRVALGSRMPWFDVTDLTGRRWTTATLPETGPVLVAFLCNHSPYVTHIERSLGRVADRVAARGVFLLALSSNDQRAYPADHREKLAGQARRSGWHFPYALDETQRAAKAFGASCTPEFFLYDRDRRLAYHGQYDATRPATSSAHEADGGDVLAAVEAVLLGEPVSPRQLPAFGCSIKWRAGNEPAYMFIDG